MLKRIVLVAICASVLFSRGQGLAASLEAQLFPYTGEVRLRNLGLAPIQFISYSITSPSGALNGSGGVWQSIADFYDTSGNGFVDPVQEWTKFTPNAGPNATNLAEGVFSGAGGSLPGQRSISLGHIWDPFAGPFPDLIFDVREPNEQLISVTTKLAIDGDFFANQTVDILDYAHWRQYFASNVILLPDGNLDGAVDAADYVVWRENAGLSIPGTAAGSSLASLAVTAVPEPSAVLLALSACTLIFAFVARRRSRLYAVANL